MTTSGNMAIRNTITDFIEISDFLSLQASIEEICEV